MHEIGVKLPDVSRPCKATGGVCPRASTMVGMRVSRGAFLGTVMCGASQRHSPGSERMRPVASAGTSGARCSDLEQLATKGRPTTHQHRSRCKLRYFSMPIPTGSSNHRKAARYGALEARFAGGLLGPTGSGSGVQSTRVHSDNILI